jgi:hypothetical protein
MLRLFLTLVTLAAVTWFTVIAWRENPLLLCVLTIPLGFPGLHRTPTIARFSRWLRGSGRLLRTIPIYVALVWYPVVILAALSDVHRYDASQFSPSRLLKLLYLLLVCSPWVAAGGFLILFATRISERFSDSGRCARTVALLMSLAIAALPALYAFTYCRNFGILAALWALTASTFSAYALFPKQPIA